jgi:hypothetical protein
MRVAAACSATAASIRALGLGGEERKQGKAAVAIVIVAVRGR